MIIISNCPVTGLSRKLEYDFLILKQVKQIIIECTIRYYNADGNEIVTNGITSFKRSLVASDSKVNAQGVLDEQGTVTEFDFYNQMGNMNIAIYAQIERIIALRDSEGKFN